jgi:hypothetical protein
MPYAFAAFFNSYEMSTKEPHNVFVKDPQKIQISLVWCLWISQQVIMTIVLLNFLIALISQKYEEAISKLQITKTAHKADLNAEFFINYKNSKFVKEGKGRIFILQMNHHNEAQAPEWNGISKTIENVYTNKHEIMIKEAIVM